jgi:hypothetical protein
MRCENEGSVVGNKQCPNDATHRVLIRREDGLYESFLCGGCFVGFREEMKAIGLDPTNEGSHSSGPVTSFEGLEIQGETDVLLYIRVPKKRWQAFQEWERTAKDRSR